MRRGSDQGERGGGGRKKTSFSTRFDLLVVLALHIDFLNANKLGRLKKESEGGTVRCRFRRSYI